MEMCNVKVAHALDTTFSALVAAENDWAKTAGRRGSIGGSGSSGSGGGGTPLLDTAAAAAAAATEGGGAAAAEATTGVALAATVRLVLRVLFVEPRPRSCDVRGHAVDVLAVQHVLSRHHRHRHRFVGLHVPCAKFD